MGELAIDLILRWMHILGAIMLVGSTIFVRFAYLPAKQSSELEPKDEFAERLRGAWSRMVVLASGALLISGLINFVLLMKRYDINKEAFPGNAYQMMFGIKFLLAFVVFFLAAALAGRSGLAQKLRQREKLWLTVNMLLAIAVVLVGGVMRMADRTEKSTSSRTHTSPSVAKSADVTSTGDES